MATSRFVSTRLATTGAFEDKDVMPICNDRQLENSTARKAYISERMREIQGYKFINTMLPYKGHTISHGVNMLNNVQRFVGLAANGAMSSPHRLPIVGSSINQIMYITSSLMDAKKASHNADHEKANGVGPLPHAPHHRNANSAVYRGALALGKYCHPAAVIKTDVGVFLQESLDRANVTRKQPDQENTDPLWYEWTVCERLNTLRTSGELPNVPITYTAFQSDTLMQTEDEPDLDGESMPINTYKSPFNLNVIRKGTFLIQEYLRGYSLANWIQSTSYNATDFIEIFKQVLCALQVLQEWKSYVHYDLSSMNVMLIPVSSLITQEQLDNKDFQAVKFVYHMYGPVGQGKFAQMQFNTKATYVAVLIDHGRSFMADLPWKYPIVDAGQELDPLVNTCNSDYPSTTNMFNPCFDMFRLWFDVRQLHHNSHGQTKQDQRIIDIHAWVSSVVKDKNWNGLLSPKQLEQYIKENKPLPSPVHFLLAIQKVCPDAQFPSDDSIHTYHWGSSGTYEHTYPVNKSKRKRTPKLSNVVIPERLPVDSPMKRMRIEPDDNARWNAPSTGSSLESPFSDPMSISTPSSCNTISQYSVDTLECDFEDSLLCTETYDSATDSVLNPEVMRMLANPRNVPIV